MGVIGSYQWTVVLLLIVFPVGVVSAGLLMARTGRSLIGALSGGVRRRSPVAATLPRIAVTSMEPVTASLERSSTRPSAPAPSRGPLGIHPARRLLAALGKDRFTSQTFADHVGATRWPAIRHGPWRSQQHQLESDNAAGLGCFFMVNNGDLRGRKSTNVVEVAAYFADFDGTALPSTWPLPPTAVVESSEGRYHVYWRVRGAPLDAFSHVQRHLSVLYDSDPKVVDLPRVMRLPGMVHAKGELFVSRLILLEPDSVVDHAVFVDAFGVPPVVTEVRQAPRPRAHAGSGRARNYLWAAVQGEHDRVAATDEGARNSTLHLAAVKLGSLVGAGVLSEADARDALLAGVNASPAPLPTWEAKRTIASGLAFGRRHPRDLDAGDT